MHVIELRDLTRTFRVDGRHISAVAGIDLTITAGEVVALLGPNGAGKTTTLDMVLGFIAPSSGTVSVTGVQPRQAVAQGRVAAVLQTGGLLRDLRVRETAELIASTYADPAPVDEVLERAGIAELTDHTVGKCSGGEQQRLRFALALLADPDLLVLDEPTVGLDVEGRRNFWTTVNAEATRGTTIVFATHYLAEAEQYAHRTVLMANGRIVDDGPTDVVRSRVAGRTVRVTLPTGTTTNHPAISTATPIGPGRWSFTTDDADALALHVLQSGGRDLEVESAGLEAVFLASTSDAQRSGVAS